VAPETFLGEPGSRDGESNLLWDLKVFANDCLCLAMFLVETGNLGGGGGVSLLSRLASKRTERKPVFCVTCSHVIQIKAGASPAYLNIYLSI
jgi:hypothetical protein